MAVSPSKMPSQPSQSASDLSTSRLPASPEKTRTLRRPQSNIQLSTQPPLSLKPRASRIGLNVKATREAFAPPPMPPSQPQPQPQSQPQSQPISSRTRANSDLPLPFERQPLRTVRNPSSQPSSSSFRHMRKASLEVTLRDGPPDADITAGLALLRHSVLTSRVAATKEGMSDYRIYLWLALLNVPPLPTERYLALIARGRSPAYDKISNDVFRTLATDTLFKRRVTDASLTRLLNATAWHLDDVRQTPSSTPSPDNDNDTATTSLYNQGMNVLAAPFLYTSRSECEAFALFTHFLTTEVPSYINPTLSGVHTALALVDKVLAIINPTLSHFLLTIHHLPANLYAFPSILTFCACTPPLPEVLHLWDFLFAYGPHLNVLCVVAQLLLLKDKLMESEQPAKLLRVFPALEAQKVIEMTLLVVRQVPDAVYGEIVRHGKQ